MAPEIERMLLSGVGEGARHRARSMTDGRADCIRTWCCTIVASYPPPILMRSSGPSGGVLTEIAAALGGAIDALI
jgi:hypothetical protein